MAFRTIMYVSTVRKNARGLKVPLGLSQICQTARKHNAEVGITGVLTFSRGYFLQVIEGDSDAIGDLYDAICRDDRHCGLVKIFDVSFNTRHFSGWSMRILSAVGRESSFQNLMTSLQPEYSELSDAKKKLLSTFYDVVPFSFNDSDFDGKSLKLSAWPDFTKIKQSPSLIELCAKLTSGAERYSELLKCGNFGTKAQLDGYLREFQKMGILVTSNDSVSEVNHERLEGSRDGFKKQQTFYNKMKKFLAFG